MAGRKKAKQIMFPASSEEFTHWVDQSDKVLVVFDVHKHWCGPCAVMNPTYNLIYLNYEDAAERVKFFSVDEDVLTDEQKAMLPLSDGCKPLFVFFKHKVIIGKVQGANGPEVESIIADNVFPVKQADD